MQHTPHVEHQSAADELLTLAQATRELPNRPAMSTVYRWHRPGLRARNGQRVRLKVERYGKRLYVRRAELRAFAERLAAADAEADAATDWHADHDAEPENAAALDAELAAEGL